LENTATLQQPSGLPQEMLSRINMFKTILAVNVLNLAICSKIPLFLQIGNHFLAKINYIDIGFLKPKVYNLLIRIFPQMHYRS